jgi:hypothetical protein
MRKLLWIIALALAALSAPTVLRADITYNIDLTVGSGSVMGTIVTDGTVGMLAASDIVGGSLTISGYSLSDVNPLPAQLYNLTGDDLTATGTSLLFNFSGGDSGGVAIGDSGGDSLYWNLSTVGYFYGCGGADENMLYAFACSASYATGTLSGDDVIGTAVSTTPEPSSVVLMLIGIGLFGFLMIRKRISLGLRHAS